MTPNKLLKTLNPQSKFKKLNETQASNFWRNLEKTKVHCNQIFKASDKEKILKPRKKDLIFWGIKVKNIAHFLSETMQMRQ